MTGNCAACGRAIILATAREEGRPDQPITLDAIPRLERIGERVMRDGVELVEQREIPLYGLHECRAKARGAAS